MAQRARPADRRMSDAEALMWSLEGNPSLRSSFLNVTFLDGAPSFDILRRRLERAAGELPRLRQVVTPASAPFGVPEWVDDPAFDIEFHLRRIALPDPGSDRQLLDLAAAECQDAFDRSRPLWRYTVVENLSGGRAALLAKMHHTVTDGVGGIRLSASFTDLERHPAEPAPSAISEHSEPPERGGDGGVLDDLSELAELVHDGLRRQFDISRRSATALAGALLHPQRLPSQAAGAADLARSVMRQLVVTDGARSPLWAGRRSLRRHFEIMSIDLERLKTVANTLGGTVNDAFVCGVAGGAGAYHRVQGSEVDELRASMAISTRTDNSAGGNAFTPARTLLSTAVDDPAARFAAVRQRLTAAKGERAVGLTATFAGVLNALPSSLVDRFAAQQVETVDFATSNLRGAPWDLYIAGAHVLGNHPMGPTGGTAFNATVLSYRGTLDMGINIDTAAVDDPALLRDCIARSFDELLALGSGPASN